MTTGEFKKQNLIEYLKDNLIFIGQYKGPLNFYSIDHDYAVLFGDYKANLTLFKKVISGLNSLLADPHISDEALAKCYYQACNGFYNNVFHSSGKSILFSKAFEAINILDEGSDPYWRLFKWLLKIKYQKEFMGLVASGPSWSDDYAIILCPTDIPESVLKQVANICWDYPVVFDRFNSYNKE